MENSIHAYLRASTKEQDAGRAQVELIEFAKQHGREVASFTLESESGAQLRRPKLLALLDRMQEGDILLIEQVDRLTRLNSDGWAKLKSLIENKKISIVGLDLPTSHAVLGAGQTDAFTSAMLDAINGMLLDMLAAISRKDYEDRRRRQAQGIVANRHKFRGRPPNTQLHKKVLRTLAQGHSQRNTAAICGCAVSTVQRVIALHRDGDSHKQQELIQ